MNYDTDDIMVLFRSPEQKYHLWYEEIVSWCTLILSFKNIAKIRTMYKHPNLLIILASKYITSLKIVNYFFFFFVSVLMFLQMETFTFLSFCIPIFEFSQKQILRQGLKCNQFVWKVIPRNTSREGDREGNTANKGAIIKPCDHL